MEQSKFHELFGAYGVAQSNFETYKTDYKIIKGNSKSYALFFDFLFGIIMNSYKDHLQQFVGEKTERILGYKQL